MGMAGMAIAYMASGKNELWALAGSVAGLGAGLLCLRLSEKRIAGRPEWTPQVEAVYKQKPKLNLERLEEIRAAVDTPLVIHGGSGLSDDDFKNSIAKGVAKMNIFTDICLAGERAMKDALEQGLGYLQTRNLKVQYMKVTVMNKMKLFGSVGKA